MGAHVGRLGTTMPESSNEPRDAGRDETDG